MSFLMEKPSYPPRSAAAGNKRTRRLIGVAIFCVCLWFFLPRTRHYVPEIREAALLSSLRWDKWGADKGEFPSDDPSTHARNSTLGFSKIIYVSLPGRRDRQDEMELMASTTNLTIELMPAVLNTELSKKEMPPGDHVLGELGCWRSHANIWKKIVKEKIETVLILEDDIDWDHNIHQVFEDFSRELRRKDEESPSAKFRLLPGSQWTKDEWKRAPYGFDWDVLYFGYEQGSPRNEDLLKDWLHFYPDRNSPPRPWTWAATEDWNHYIGRGLQDTGLAPKEGPLEDGRWFELQRAALNASGDWGAGAQEDAERELPFPRMIFPSNAHLGTWAYAITYRGAQRLLYNIGYHKGLDMPVDWALKDLLSDGRIHGLSVMPPIFWPWKVGGAKDSDLRGGNEAWDTAQKPSAFGKSANMRNSQRELLESEFHRIQGEPLQRNAKTKNYWHRIMDHNIQRMGKTVEGYWEEQKAKWAVEEKKRIEMEEKQKNEEMQKKKEKEKSEKKDGDKKQDKEKNDKEEDEDEKEDDDEAKKKDEDKKEDNEAKKEKDDEKEKEDKKKEADKKDDKKDEVKNDDKKDGDKNEKKDEDKKGRR